MFKYSAFMAPNDPEGIWTFDQENQELRRSKRVGVDTEGDIKLTYQVIKGF